MKGRVVLLYFPYFSTFASWQQLVFVVPSIAGIMRILNPRLLGAPSLHQAYSFRKTARFIEHFKLYEQF